MKKETRISIVIPVKGTPPSLLSSLKGFLNQTMSPYEIVIVGASKDLAKIKKSLNSKEKGSVKFIKFLGGKNEARNRGVLDSTGEFILYADHDMIPQTDLIESCMNLLERFDALIIPERGAGGGNLLKEIHRLEKEMVMDDLDAVTPRLFRRALFAGEELPFDRKFGVLDEWGFNLKLKTKNPRIGMADSFLTIAAEDLTLWRGIKKQFRKGLWVRNLISADRQEALRRINPVKRGIQFYGSRLNILKKEPIVFSGLLFLKFIDFVSFFSGYVMSFIMRPKEYKADVMKTDMGKHEKS
ncbi:glycosyltransferase family 2 protein [Patescibacteria group bacterium]|nr:glycosyltransferase family 2 protein [Patescibacteria group bacterium]